MSKLNVMINLVQRALHKQERLWFEGALDKLKEDDDPLESLLFLSACVKRKLTQIQQIDNPILPTNDSVELVRICLCGFALVYRDLEILSTLKAYYQAGDSSEKTAMLSGLVLLDPEGVGVDIAVRAARVNSLDEFSALALNNLYPALHFEQLNFNQLVLKTLFNGLQIDTVLGLNDRLSPQLSNMCFSYLIEQALARRSPPSSIWLAIRFRDLDDEHLAMFEQYVSHYLQDTAHQTYLQSWLKGQDVSLLGSQ